MSGSRKRGSAIAFGAALALILVIVGVAFVFITMYMGAGNETKNAVDAGALNVGKQVIDEPHVTLSGGPEQFFADVTKDGQTVNLRNINRVWGKAFLVALNADAAQAGGYALPTAINDAQQVVDAAGGISDRLADLLNDPANLYTPFENYAQANSVRMLGNGAQISALKGTEWQTSFMVRNDESNVSLYQTQIPPGYNLPTTFYTQCTRTPMPADAKVDPFSQQPMLFLRGYAPLNFTNVGRVLWQVPFQYEEMPHLVASTDFENSKNPALSWQKAVPNAFSVKGQALKSGSVGESAMSWVLTDPHETYPIQIPHGYVRVVLNQNTCSFKVLSTFPLGSDQNYNFSSDGVGTDKFPIYDDLWAAGNASVGNEYVTDTLYEALVGPSSYEDPGQVLTNLLQRCQELVPVTSKNDLIAALKACPIDSGGNAQTFYIYPENGKLVAKSDSNANLPGPFYDKTGQPEGTEQDMGTWDDGGMINSGTVDIYVFVLVYINVTKFVPSILHHATVDTTIVRKWVPGTGYLGGCLGELRATHQAHWTVP